ncbi:hypothetical protein M885DRAFT_534916 [Pelagophyceae sp. CCMP2097]|nr:hypothetical protein M885DRAFT_534916 [Pelagophyceae sp. CCMP2097]
MPAAVAARASPARAAASRSPSPARERRLAVGIVVVEARGLAVSDRADRAKRSTYVVAKILSGPPAAADERRDFEAYFRTKVRFDAVAPKWGQQFVARLPRSVVVDGTAVFYVVSTDKATGDEHFLGRCAVPLAALQAEGNAEPRWLQLKKTAGAARGGELRVVVVVRKDDSGAADVDALVSRAGAAASPAPLPVSSGTQNKARPDRGVESFADDAAESAAAESGAANAAAARRALERGWSTQGAVLDRAAVAAAVAAAKAQAAVDDLERQRGDFDRRRLDDVRQRHASPSRPAPPSPSWLEAREPPPLVAAPAWRPAGAAPDHDSARRRDVSPRDAPPPASFDSTELVLAMFGVARVLFGDQASSALPEGGRRGRLAYFGYFVGAPRGWEQRCGADADADAVVRCACREAVRREAAAHAPAARWRRGDTAVPWPAAAGGLADEMVLRLRGFEAFALSGDARRALLVGVVDVCGGGGDDAARDAASVQQRLHSFAQDLPRPQRTAVVAGAERARALAALPRRRVVRRALVLGALAHATRGVRDRELAVVAANLARRFPAGADAVRNDGAPHRAATR